LLISSTKYQNFSGTWPDKQDEQLRKVFLYEFRHVFSQPDVDICLTMKTSWFNNHAFKNEEQLLERLDKAILKYIIPRRFKKPLQSERYYDKRSKSSRHNFRSFVSFLSCIKFSLL
jgi:hypothetical protein